MPLINVRTSLPEVVDSAALLKELSAALAQQTGKPESYVGQLVNDGIQRKIIIIVATMLVVSEVLLMIEDEEQFKRTTTDLRTELVSFQLLLQIAGGNVRAEPFASNMVGRTYLLH